MRRLPFARLLRTKQVVARPSGWAALPSAMEGCRMKIKVATNKKLIGQERAEKVAARRARRKGADVSVQPG